MKLVNWMLTPNGCIRAEVEGDEARAIKTSRVASRDGDVVTTHSGSQYKLGDPHPYMLDPQLQGDFTPMQLIDFAVQEYRTQNDG